MNYYIRITSTTDLSIPSLPYAIQPLAVVHTKELQEKLPLLIQMLEKLPVCTLFLDIRDVPNPQEVFTKFKEEFVKSVVLQWNSIYLIVLTPIQIGSPITCWADIPKWWEQLPQHHLNDFVLNYVPPLLDGEGFYYMVLFRRKWLIKQNPGSEETYRQYFKADEMKIIDGVSSGPPFKLVGDLQAAIKTVKSENHYKVYKGKCFRIAGLYKNFPLSFSLLITFEPRNIIKGLQNYTLQMVKDLIQGEAYKKCALKHPTQGFLTEIHKARRSNHPKYVLLDLDFSHIHYKLSELKYNHIKEWRANFLKELKKELDQHNLIPDLAYACSTPSYGLHLIFKITKNTQHLFKERKEWENKILTLGVRNQYFLESIELKTGQCLIHVPGFNYLVENLTPYLKREV